MPTFCEIAGARVPSDADGVSFAPMLQGQAQEARAFLYREFPSYGGQVSLRMGNWKAVRRAPSRPIELYNLRSDIGEDNNIANEHPDIVAKAKEFIDKSRTDADIWPLKDRAK